MASPYEIGRTTQIVDVRPWGDRVAEMLTDPITMAFSAGMVIVFTIAMPTLLIVSIPLLLIMFISARNVGCHLPLRYPPSAKNPENGKSGDGIMYLGNMDFDRVKTDRLPLESLADKFKECWFSDDDMRKHLLVLGSTGSGKSELLKGIFFNALCWGSGFFVADGKADNKLFLDTYNLARFFGRDDDLLSLNFLLAGKTPEQVRNSRRRRTNRTNPFSTADSDTIIQMGANLLPKVDGDAKNWQEKALNCWRGLVPALCWKRDHQGAEISVRTFVDSLALVELEKLYAEGYTLAQQNRGVWPEAFEGLKAYLEVGLPGFKLDRALKKHGAVPKNQVAGGKPEPMDQDATTYDQHGYRATQLNPALNLLDKTYGHIFTDKFSEIDMVDVTLNNRILVLMIPSLEKSAQEAESLGKLTVACLRVMMGKNLGAEIEGHRREILESKATEANYPYIVALDELGYYFADGIAVMFAQARSLGFSMIAAAQDIEKLTEGSRAAEAGAMLANQVVKVFMRIDDANKTNEMIQKYLGKANVALRKTYEHRSGFGFKKLLEVHIEEIPRATLENLQKLKPGRAVLNAMGDTFKIRSFYVGDFLAKYPSQEFHINRFLQVRGYTATEIEQMSLPIDIRNAPEVRGQRLKDLLTGEAEVPDLIVHAERQPYAQQFDAALGLIEAVAEQAKQMPGSKKGAARAAMLFGAAQKYLEKTSEAGSSLSSGGQKDQSASHVSAQNNSGTALPDAGVDLAVAAGIRVSTTVPPVVSGDRIEEGSGSGQGGKSVDVFAVDPFDFLNAGAPLNRKPVAEVMGSPISALQQEGAQETLKNLMGGASMPSVRAQPIEPILPIDTVADTAREVDDGVQKATKPGIDVLAPYLMQDLQEVWVRAGDVDLGLGSQETHAERLGLRTPVVPDAAPPAAAMWVGQALQGAIAAMSSASKGATVVGFTPPAKEALIQLESAMGSSNPAAATAAVERIVSNQATPPHKEPGPFPLDDVDALMSLIDQSGVAS